MRSDLAFYSKNVIVLAFGALRAVLHRRIVRWDDRELHNSSSQQGDRLLTLQELRR
jgi:hypothetical protein